MAEFPLEQIKIGDNVYKIAAGASGPNMWFADIQYQAVQLRDPSGTRITSIDQLKVGDTVFCRKSWIGEYPINGTVLRRLDIGRNSYNINVVNGGGTTGTLSVGRSWSLIITAVNSDSIDAYITLIDIAPKIELSTGTSSWGFNAETIAYQLRDYIGGGTYSTYSGQKPEVMHKVGDLWQPVDVQESWAVYDLSGKLAYIVNGYNWGDIDNLKSFQFNGTADSHVTAVLCTSYIGEGDPSVYYDRNAGCDVWYPEGGGNRLYQLNNSTFMFGGKAAIFGMNGYDFG